MLHHVGLLLMYLTYYILTKINLFDAATGIFKENEINALAADALAPDVTRSSVAMTLNM